LVWTQHVHVNRISFMPDLWWFRYSPLAARFFHGLARHFTTGSVLQTSRLLPQMLRRLREKRR
jgi:hypothetical protein